MSKKDHRDLARETAAEVRDSKVVAWRKRDQEASQEPLGSWAKFLGVGSLTLAHSLLGPASLAHSAPLAAVVASHASSASTVAAAPLEPVRIVVRFKTRASVMRASTPEEPAAVIQAARVSALSARAGVTLRHMRVTGAGASLYGAAAPMTRAQVQALAIRVEQDPSVASAELDFRVNATQAPPNDPYYASQWPLADFNERRGGSNFKGAWPLSTGAGVIVAVLDSGSTEHPDLDGRQVAGYDFVTGIDMALDANGRDSSPADPGDHCTTELGTLVPNSWHGTAVASQIAAVSNNSYGITGAAHGARIMHVRVLGLCNKGWATDVSDAIAWVAGIPVGSLPAAKYKARVINLSLGAEDTCPSFMQDSIAAANRRGIVVVAAAGNNASGSILAPANCKGVIAVGAHTASADLADYSNYSAEVALTAPGGGSCKQTLTGCDSASTLASGVSGASSFEGYLEQRPFTGTSAATPHVAAAAALILSYSPFLTTDQVRSALTTSARRHPTDSFCAVAGRCGAGMLDAAKALAAVGAPLVSVSYGSNISQGTSGPVKPGIIARSATGSITAKVSGLSPVTLTWKQLSGPAVVVVTTAGDANTRTLVFKAPSTAGLILFEATAVSATGKTAKNTLSVRVNNPPVLLAASVLPVAKTSVPYSTSMYMSDPDWDALSISAPGLPVGFSFQGYGQLVGTGAYPSKSAFQVSVRDPYGQTVTKTYELTIEGPLTTPLVTSQSFTARASAALTAQIVATARKFAITAYTLPGAPAGMSVSNAGTLSWPLPVAGNHYLSVLVKNSAGQSSRANISVLVGPANRRPLLPGGQLSGTDSEQFSTHLRSTDPDGDKVTFSMVGAPAGLSITSTGKLAWVKPLAGKYSFTVKATDPYRAAAATKFTLTVMHVNIKPTLMAATIDLASGKPLAYQVLGRDPNGDTLTYTMSAAPPGMTLSGTGMLSWPRPAAGAYKVAIRARDISGLSATAMLAVSVAAARSGRER